MRSNQQIEMARLLGLLAVVVVHVNAMGFFDRSGAAVGWFADEFSRFSVPVFFMISGYFWEPEKSSTLPLVWRLARKLALPFVVWVAIYILLDATQLLYPSAGHYTWHKYLKAPWTGSVAFHLWFLPALVVGTFIGFGLVKRFGIAIALTVALLLALIGVFLGTYIQLFGITLPLGVYRNGIFFAPIFLVGGFAFSRMQERPSLGTCLAMAAAGFLVCIAEGILIVHSNPHAHDLSLGTMPFAFGVFGIILNLRISAPGLASWGRDVFGGYLVHVLLLNILVGHMAPPQTLVVTFAVILAVTIVSLVISHIAIWSRYTRPIMP